MKIYYDVNKRENVSKVNVTEKFTYKIDNSRNRKNPLLFSIKYIDNYQEKIHGYKIEIDDKTNDIKVYSYSFDEHIHILHCFYSDRSKNSMGRLLNNDNYIYFSNENLCKKTDDGIVKLATLPKLFSYGSCNYPYSYVIPEYSSISLVSSYDYDILYMYNFSGERLLEEEKKYRYINYIVKNLMGLFFNKVECFFNFDSLSSKEYDKVYTLEYIKEICEQIKCSHNLEYNDYTFLFFDVIEEFMKKSNLSIDTFDIGKLIFVLAQLREDILDKFLGYRVKTINLDKYILFIITDFLCFLLKEGIDIFELVNNYDNLFNKFVNYINDTVCKTCGYGEIKIIPLRFSNTCFDSKILVCIINKSNVITNVIFGNEMIIDKEDKIGVLYTQNDVTYITKLENKLGKLISGVYKDNSLFYFEGDEFLKYNYLTGDKTILSKLSDIMIFSDHFIYADSDTISFIQKVDECNVFITFDYEGNIVEDKNKKLINKDLLSDVIFLSEKEEIFNKIDLLFDKFNIEVLKNIGKHIRNGDEKIFFVNIIKKLARIVHSVNEDIYSLDLHKIYRNLSKGVYPDSYIYDYYYPKVTYNVYMLYQIDKALENMMSTLTLCKCYEVLSNSPKMIENFSSVY